MKKDNKKEQKKQTGEVSRRDFLVGAGTVVVGGTIGAGLLSSCGDGEEKTVTTTIEKTKTVTTTIGEGVPVTVTETRQVGAGETVTKTTTITGTGEAVEPAFEEEESVISAFSMNGSAGVGELCSVEVKNGKIIRTRPLHYDENYTEEELAPTMWKYEARGKTLVSATKSLPNYFSYGFKNRAYSPNRILYPLQRVDWDPDADPATGRNTQNRGKSKYKRISWDTAATIIAKEIKRIHDTYGQASLFCHSRAHGQSKNLHLVHGSHSQLLQMFGTYSTYDNNPDSWEGWFWGGQHVAGTGNVGLLTPYLNVVKDVSENTELIVHEGSDWETTPGGFSGQYIGTLAYWFSELGIKQIYVCPDLNYAAAVHADKWIPILPDTDAALQLAIIYTWIKENTYDQEYLDTHAIGFDANHMPENTDPKENFKDYVLGTYDGVPKTPAWASSKCGIPAWTIKALARQWAAKKTSTAHFFGGSFQRGPYAHEPARLSYVQLAMQGLGKPGIQQLACYALHPPRSSTSGNQFSKIPRPTVTTPPRTIALTMVPTAILNPPMEWWGGGMGYAVSDQFIKREYPGDVGEIHMYWTDCPCATTCWNNGYYWQEAFRSPKIEFMLAQHPWFEDDCAFADIVLPGTTVYEDDDIIAQGRAGVSRRTVAIQKAAIENIAETKSDYEAVCEIAKKLEEYGGVYADAYQNYTGGMTIDEQIKVYFENYSGIQTVTTWDEFSQKGYWVAPVATDWQDDVPGKRAFYEDPEANPTDLPSGLFEIYSSRIAEIFPDDDERGPHPKYVEGGSGWTHDESISGERAKDYPLLIVSNHPRWRFHAECDDIPWFREIPTSKVKGYDGYMYEPLWINPVDAAKRGVENGDIVKIYNDRGIVLGGAYVTERIKPGVVYQDHGARVDIITEGIDRGGANNLIAPYPTTSKYAWGQATSGYLVEVGKLDPEQMEEWRKAYPEAFARDYDPYHGLHFSAWLADDDKGGAD